MNAIRQLAMLLRMNLLGVTQRLGLAATTVIGVTCAVGVLVAMLAMGAGARREAMGNVRPDRVMILSVGAMTGAESNISKDTAALIHELPGIRRNASGEPIAVPQALVFIQARKKVSRTLIQFVLVGSGKAFTDFTPELHMTSGRMYRPGLHELIASNYCAREFENFGVGDKRVLQGGEWRVVGNFDLGKTEGVCVTYTDADTLLSAVGRDSYSQVVVMLQSPEAFEQLVSAVKANPLIKVQVKHEAEMADIYTMQIRGILNFVSFFVGAILALAATIGAANSLYAVVDSRRRELATLRAVGFSAVPLIVATLLEAIFLAIPGALIGTGLAWLFFNGLSASPFGYQFHLAVMPSLVLLGVGWALCMGLIGGLMPAVRAARVPVTVALRAM